jgi:hypothetical protein
VTARSRDIAEQRVTGGKLRRVRTPHTALHLLLPSEEWLLMEEEHGSALEEERGLLEQERVLLEEEHGSAAEEERVFAEEEWILLEKDSVPTVKEERVSAVEEERVSLKEAAPVMEEERVAEMTEVDDGVVAEVAVGSRRGGSQTEPQRQTGDQQRLSIETSHRTPSCRKTSSPGRQNGTRPPSLPMPSAPGQLSPGGGQNAPRGTNASPLGPRDRLDGSSTVLTYPTRMKE